MQQRRLGNSPVQLSAIGLGCMSMTGIYGAADDAESIATIHRALERGICFLDTADAYGQGQNEALVGQAIADRRDQVVLATKFGNVMRDGKAAANGRPEYVIEACEKSLKRLGVDVIDLYFQHRVDSDVPIEETVGAMAKLVEQGKVRYLGLSEAAVETVRRAHAVAPISALQTEYSLWTRFCEEELLPLCKELDITYVAYSPLGRGFLTGAVKGQTDLAEQDRRRILPRFSAENLPQNLALLGPIEELAAAKGCTPAQIALAWVLAQGDLIVPIPSSKSRKHLEENAAAVDIELSPSELAALSAAAPPDFTVGDRYHEEQMRIINA